MQHEAYPYSGRDLFAEPESYFYASCSSPSYLAAWRGSRLICIQRLLERADQDDAPSDLDRLSTTNDGLALREHLGRILSGMNREQLSLAEGAREIRPFLVKYEVFKRLHSHYTPALRKAPDARLADLETYVLLAECLALISEAGQSLKHLSTLVKLCDALGSQPPDRFRPREAERLARVLTLEARLVGTLEDQNAGP